MIDNVSIIHVQGHILCNQIMPLSMEMSYGHGEVQYLNNHQLQLRKHGGLTLKEEGYSDIINAVV